MTAQKIKNRIAEGVTLFGFLYNGKEGNVDPYYSPTDGQSYLLFYSGSEQTVYTLDDVMSTPFFDGKPLNDIAEVITITDW